MTGRRIGAWIGLAALVGVLLAAPVGSASGYFQAEGGGTAAVAVAALGAPGSLTANAAAPGTVALAWEAAGAPAGGDVSYYVTRDGKAAGGNCPSAAAPAAGVLACTDTGVEAGTHVYAVWARWRSWTATSAAAEVTITYAAGSHLQIKAASTKPTAGASDNLTITAEDGSGHVITGYTGAHVLTFAGAATSPGGNAPTVVDDSGSAVEFGRPTELEFKAGVATVRSKQNGLMVLYAAGATTISATDGSLAGETETALTVAPKAKSQFALKAGDVTPQAGESDPLEVVAEDAYGNTVISFSGNHSLVYSGATASPGGELPTVTNRNGKAIAFGSATSTTFSAGTAAPAGSSNGVMTLYGAGTAALTVAEGSVGGGQVAIVVSSAAPASLALSAASATPTAGGTDDLTTTALDAYGNTAGSYAGSHEITFSGPEASPGGTAAAIVDAGGTAVNIGSPTTLDFTAGVAAVAASANGVLTPARAGATSLTATDGKLSTATALELAVAAGTATQLAWSAPAISAGTLGSPCLFTCTVTKLGNGGTFTAKVAVTDALGNVAANLGSSHRVTVTATAGSTVTGGSLTIASTGPAESTSSFTYRSRSSGSFTDTITAARSSGTVYTSATATTSR